MTRDPTTSWARAAGWAGGVALAVAATVALVFALILRISGVDVLLLGARWEDGVGADVAVSILVAGLAVAVGLVLAVRLRPTEVLPWRWLLAAAVLVIPCGAVLELVAAILRGVLGLDVPA
ncbi:hypothetical protein ACHAAC_07810 [Aeromicrobium sp. CF4.19]|uniref:hypothetical protein n=1 Tax=Aeromicrobium sp. CF4.19 TaxID=3373082 RepID=UPI003EE52B1C